MILALLVLAVGGRTGAPQQRDPGDVLRTLEEDLRKATRGTPDQREKLRIASKTAFDKDVAAAVLKNPKPAWDHFADYLTSLGRAERSFGGKNESAERALWILGCKQVLQRQLNQCKESKLAGADLPTTTELFNALVD